MNETDETIHLINRLDDASGGSDWRTLNLFDALSAASNREILLWSTTQPARELPGKYPIRTISTWTSYFPKKGTFIFTNNDQTMFWAYRTRPARTILFYNSELPHRFRKQRELLSSVTERPVEVVYASRWMRDSMPYPGEIEPSLIDLQRFIPDNRDAGERKKRPFTLGRLSRDVAEKFNDHDPALYSRLVELGCEIRIMGGSCLMNRINGAPGISLLPALHEPAEKFLRALDGFLYRTQEGFRESFGRAVVEAMACGLPVVCEKEGGYLDVIEHGVNGFLFETNDEAEKIILRLKSNPGLRESIGREARYSMERLYAKEKVAQRVDYYLNG